MAVVGQEANSTWSQEVAKGSAWSPEEHMVILKRQFNSMAAPHLCLYLRDPSFPWAWSNLQGEVVHIVEAPLNSQYPPSTDYKKNFLKSFIAALEKRNIEVEDPVYEAYAGCVTSRSDDAAGAGHKTYVISDTLHLTVRERKELISLGTTGLVTWQAGPAMIEWLLARGDMASLFAGKRVLELGSGVGLLGMAISRLCCPQTVFLSDCHEEVLDTLACNVQLNRLADATTVVSLDWEHTADEFLLSTLAPDLVIASDIIYDTTLFPGLVHVLQTLLHRRQCRALLACTVRNPATLAAFVGRLDAVHLAVTVVPVQLGGLFVYEQYTEVVVLDVTHRSE